MPVMSFAHLKNRTGQAAEPKNQEKAKNSPAVVDSRLTIGVGAVEKKILSFAHLKHKRTGGVGRVNEETVKEVIHEETKQARTTFSIPAVMPTALLVAVNYCRGCGRFLAAGENETNNPYGRCLRDAPEESEYYEVYKIIPKTAKVSRCYYWIKNQKQVKT